MVQYVKLVINCRQVNLIGEKVVDPLIHSCEKCSLPILIYGRMVCQVILLGVFNTLLNEPLFGDVDLLISIKLYFSDILCVMHHLLLLPRLLL